MYYTYLLIVIIYTIITILVKLSDIDYIYIEKYLKSKNLDTFITLKRYTKDKNSKNYYFKYTKYYDENIFNSKIKEIKKYLDKNIFIEHLENNILQITILNKIENIEKKFFDDYIQLGTYLNKPLSVNMTKYPHIGVVGNSYQGKTTLVEKIMLTNQTYNYVILNHYDTDYKKIKCRKINKLENIYNFLNTLTYQEKKLIIVIDEYNSLSQDTKINKLITNMLNNARHNNIYIICIMQQGTKEECKFKNLFNTRICFDCEESLMTSFLRCKLENIEKIYQYEYYVKTDKIYKCKL